MLSEGLAALRPTSIQPSKLSAVFENPLQDVPREQLMSDVENFCKEFGLLDHLDVFQKGALVAQNPTSVQDMNDLLGEALYLKQLNVTPKRFSPNIVDNLTGLIVGTPYLSCAILGCWLTEPLNGAFAR